MLFGLGLAGVLLILLLFVWGGLSVGFDLAFAAILYILGYMASGYGYTLWFLKVNGTSLLFSLAVSSLLFPLLWKPYVWFQLKQRSWWMVYVGFTVFFITVLFMVNLFGVYLVDVAAGMGATAGVMQWFTVTFTRVKGIIQPLLYIILIIIMMVKVYPVLRKLSGMR